MNVILAAKINGTRDGQDWPAVGTEVNLPEAEARGMIASGSAIPTDHELADSLRKTAGASARPFEFLAPVEAAVLDTEPVKRNGR